jgi:integrase
MANNKRKRTPKTVLKLPDLEQSKSAVLNSLPSVSSRRFYDHAIGEFIDWYCSERRLAFNKTVVTRYRIYLAQARYASSTINLRLAAVRRLAYEAADAGLLSRDLGAGIRRVKGAKKHGVRIGNWLTAEQGRTLLAAFGSEKLRDKRDYAIVAVLLGCGLRRTELAAASMQDLQQREEHWICADLIGKGGHIRTVPIPNWVGNALQSWTSEAAIPTGPIFRAINKAGRIPAHGFRKSVKSISSPMLKKYDLVLRISIKAGPYPPPLSAGASREVVESPAACRTSPRPLSDPSTRTMPSLRSGGEPDKSLPSLAIPTGPEATRIPVSQPASSGFGLTAMLPRQPSKKGSIVVWLPFCRGIEEQVT